MRVASFLAAAAFAAAMATPVFCSFETPAPSGTTRNTPAPTNPANEIPLFIPSQDATVTHDTAHESMTIDPLSQVGSPSSSATATATGATTPSATPTPAPVPSPSWSHSYDFHEVFGQQCNETYAYGAFPVSVQGRGTFCAHAPVCSGEIVGNCPTTQPGLYYPTRCEKLEGDVFGCVP